LTEAELQIDRIDRGHGFIASPFVQHQIYREAVYIFYGKLSVYLKALQRDAGQDWAMWVDEASVLAPFRQRRQPGVPVERARVCSRTFRWVLADRLVAARSGLHDPLPHGQAGQLVLKTAYAVHGQDG
jgi:hypothetical protein